MLGEDLAQALTDGLGGGYEVVGLGRGEMGAAVASPKAEPGGEVGFVELQGNVFPRHGTGIEAWASGNAGPKVSDFFQMRGPVLDMGGKDGRDLVVLAHIGIEIAEEL